GIILAIFLLHELNLVSVPRIVRFVYHRVSTGVHRLLDVTGDGKFDYEDVELIARKIVDAVSPSRRQTETSQSRKGQKQGDEKGQKASSARTEDDLQNKNNAVSTARDTTTSTSCRVNSKSKAPVDVIPVDDFTGGSSRQFLILRVSGRNVLLLFRK
ncbi:unnamed protein product, partial [Amoebophrya sp. A25]